MDLLPFVLGTTDGEPHAALFWRSIYNSAVRRGPWKLIVQVGGSPDAEAGDREFLFNLEIDRGESENLAGSHPELVAELRALLRQWASELSEPLWPPVMHFWMDVWGVRHWFAI